MRDEPGIAEGVSGGSLSVECAERLSTETAQPHERQTLALDALAKLTRQFSAKPDFDHLINVILMTLCGQFAVANSFAALRKPRSPGVDCVLYGTGRFKTNADLKALCANVDQWNWRKTDGGICRICDLQHLVGSMQVISALGEADVAVVCQLVHGDKVLGMIGMGRKVSTRPYTARDLGLIHSIVNTITPLVANTYMFWDMVSLNAEYLEIINRVRQGIFVFDCDCKLRRVNSAGLEIIRSGGPSDQGPVIDAPIEMVFPTATFTGWARLLRDAMTGGRPRIPESVVARRDGADRVYNVGISGSAPSAGAGATVVLTLDDVTTQKESEHRLFDLAQAADGDAMGASGETGLREAVKRVATGLDAITSALAGGDIPEASAVVASLKSVLASQGYFVPGLQDADDIAANMQRGNLNSVISGVLSFLTMQHRYKQIPISPDLDFGVPDMILNPDRIAVVLLNLLSNAADAVNASGRATGHISIRTARNEGEVLLVVSDNGSGVDPATAARLFKDQVTTKPRGRGCGLVTCRKIIETHGGSVSIESRPGEGTKVIVRLPLRGLPGGG
jgi:anti-sigma regulatory factor (Ser/Thr protein kinase)